GSRTPTGVPSASFGWRAASQGSSRTRASVARRRSSGEWVGVRLRFASKPLVSIVMPTHNSSLPWLRETIDSVLAHAYPHWELCIADDAPPKAEVRELLTEYAARDCRIRLVFRDQNSRTSAATNSALAI